MNITVTKITLKPILQNQIKHNTNEKTKNNLYRLSN